MSEVWILFETQHDFYGSETSRRVVLVCTSSNDARAHLKTMPSLGMSGIRFEVERYPISGPPFKIKDAPSATKCLGTPGTACESIDVDALPRVVGYHTRRELGDAPCENCMTRHV